MEDMRLLRRILIAGRASPRFAPSTTGRPPHRACTPAQTPFGKTLGHIAKYHDGFGLLLTDGRIEIVNKTVDYTIRYIAQNSKSAQFETMATAPKTASPSSRPSTPAR